MKPRIKPLPRTGDAERYLVDGKPTYVPGGLILWTGKHPLTLLGEQIEHQRQQVRRLTAPSH
jgi:hypothetical protein